MTASSRRQRRGWKELSQVLVSKDLKGTAFICLSLLAKSCFEVLNLSNQPAYPLFWVMTGWRSVALGDLSTFKIIFLQIWGRKLALIKVQFFFFKWLFAGSCWSSMLSAQYSELFDNYSTMFSFLVDITLKQINLSDKFGIFNVLCCQRYSTVRVTGRWDYEVVELLSANTYIKIR